MSAAKFNLKLINSKVFIAVLVFSLFNGLYETVAPFFSHFLINMGYTFAEMSVAVSFWGTIVFISRFVSLFTILYLICRGGFVENVASISVSLIAGNIFGYWIGGLLGVLVIPSGPPATPSVFVVGSLLGQFGACAAAYVNSRWNASMARSEMSPERPFGVTVIAFLYIVLGMSLLVLTGTIFGLLSSISFKILLSKVLIFSGLIVLVTIASSLCIILAYGFYDCRKWGWFAVFSSTLIGMFSSINSFALAFHFDIWSILKLMVLVLDILVLAYVLQPHVRIYFGITNTLIEDIQQAKGEVNE